nr:MAG TPA: hypothetical protein [Caudoviricetes sp.]
MRCLCVSRFDGYIKHDLCLLVNTPNTKSFIFFVLNVLSACF